jgi:hypothetical protein
MSPSTEIMLKLASVAARSSACKAPRDIGALVAMKASIVAMLGAIMPEPLAMPPTT